MSQPALQVVQAVSRINNMLKLAIFNKMPSVLVEPESPGGTLYSKHTGITLIAVSETLQKNENARHT